MKEWLLHGEPILEAPEDAFGFIYLIINTKNNRFYIGKKNLIKKGGKASDWKDYYGSCDQLKEDVKLFGKEKFLREILKFCPNKINLTYWEMFYQMKYGVLLTPSSYNSCINGKFFKGKIK